MEIYSVHNVRFPDREAHSLSVLRTSLDLTAFGDVHLYADPARTRRTPGETYGFDPTAYPRFHLRLAHFRHKGLAGIEKRGRLLAALLARRRTPPLVYVTQHRPLAFAAAAKRLGARCRILLELHTEEDLRDPRLLKAVDAVVFLSETLQRRVSGRTAFPLRSAVCRHRVRIAPCGPVPPPRRAPEFVLGYAGGLQAWKGVDTIARALALLPARVHAVFWGARAGSARDRDRFLRAAAELGVLDRTTLREYVPQPALASVAGEVDALVLPLLDAAGSLPMKLFDYLPLGRPIIASRQPSIAEVLEDGRSALLFHPGDPQDLASSVRRLLDAPALGHRLAREARMLAENYTVERWRAEIARVLAGMGDLEWQGEGAGWPAKGVGARSVRGG